MSLREVPESVVKALRRGVTFLLEVHCEKGAQLCTMRALRNNVEVYFGKDELVNSNKS